MNPKKILITGGSGFLGRALVSNWLAHGYKVTLISRNPTASGKLLGPDVKIVGDFSLLPSDACFDIAVNLAGEPILAGRWSDARKQLLRDSRIGITERLLAYIALLPVKPEVLISGSAIGIYGDHGDALLTESDSGVADFSQKLCSDWENAALQAEKMGIRVCLIRTGLVLDQGGGMLQKMLPAFQLGLGGRLGDGRQWMSWIHRRDWLAIVEFLINNTGLQGVFNATAPQPVINREFSISLAKQLHRPLLLPVPASLLKLLLGEMAELVLSSQRVIPQRLLDRGFKFEFVSLESALRQILDKH